MSPEGYQLQRDLLGFDPFVYPGHAVTVALFIIHAFDSFEDATRTEARNFFPNALGSHLIPGAGGNVYGALALLRHLREGMPWGKAIEIADRNWKDCDGHFGTLRWRSGQEQADRLKPHLNERVWTWLKKGPTS